MVFLDELDSLCPRRDGSQSDVERRVVAALLAQLDAPVGGATDARPQRRTGQRFFHFFSLMIKMTGDERYLLEAKEGKHFFFNS